MDKLALLQNSRCAKVVVLPQQRAVKRQALERLYLRRATIEALIQSLEDYARCRYPEPVIPLLSRGN